MIKNLTAHITFFCLAMTAMGTTSTISFSNADELLLFVKSLLPKNPIILEAGGHLGEDTIRMKTVWPHATMHVFEPLPTSFEQMVKTIQHLSNVFCYPYALSNYSGQTNFFIDIPNSGACSIGKPVAWNQSEFKVEPIQVPCITISDWARNNNVNRIDFMWLDMEGHELYALQHASNILASVRAIYTEISFVPVRENGCLYQNLKTFLENQGFHEVWKESFGRFGNALFIRDIPRIQG